MNARTALPAALLLFAASLARAGEGDGPSMTFRLADEPGRPATADDTLTAFRILACRFSAAGLAGIRITPHAEGRIDVTLPRGLAEKAESVWQLAERSGTVELRIQADAAKERELRKAHEEQSGAAGTPPEFAWVPCLHDAHDMLVCTPEKPLLLALQRLDKAGVAHDAVEYVAAKKAYEEVVRDEVFTGDQIRRAEVQAQNTKDVVFFSFKEDRRPFFAAFTERHVHECLAIILDGKVDSAPLINSKLPGEGIIEGIGPTGFTDAEANALVAVLLSGALPRRLVRVAPGEAAAPSGELLLAYSAAAWDGAGRVMFDDPKTAADVVVKRCAHAGFDGVVACVGADGASVEVRVPKALAADETAIRHLVERRGDVSFRVRAPQKLEDEQRDKRLNEGAPPPEGYTWIPDERSSLMALVETPEAPLAAKLAALLQQKGSGPDVAAAYDEGRSRLDAVRAASVFTNEDIVAASVRRSLSTYGAQSLMHVNVRFEFADPRKAAFEKFTGANVGRELCVVVEGKVHVAPVINSAIPGAGELRAPGTGYTETEAQEMAAILECGPLPLRLVPRKEK
jgi:preprotein translocase subunit SecD